MLAHTYVFMYICKVRYFGLATPLRVVLTLEFSLWLRGESDANASEDF